MLTFRSVSHSLSAHTMPTKSHEYSQTPLKQRAKGKGEGLAR